MQVNSAAYTESHEQWWTSPRKSAWVQMN